MIYAIFGIVWFVILFIVLMQVQLGKLEFPNKPEFESPFYDLLYRLSFVYPFKWFVDDDKKLTAKGLQVKEELRITGMDKKYTAQSFMAYKVIMLMIALILAGLLVLILKNSSVFMTVMLGMKQTTEEAGGVSNRTLIFVMSACLLIPLFPGMGLKNKAKRALVSNTKDLPMIQMFTILMLRSNKTVSEILFALSKLNTNHKEVFERGYRIYLRNKHEGMSYLRSQFSSDRFIETFNLLEDIAEYAREECIKIMESNMKSLIDDTNTIKRKNDLSKLVYSHASMMIPFAGVLLLGAAPVIIMGVSIMGGSMLGGAIE